MLENKWLRGAIPALFIHSCIGSVYCWSLLKDSIAAEMGVAVGSIEFAFTLAIFFLGMSAAFGGSIVEKDVKRSGLLSTIFFVSGLLLSVLSIKMQSVVGLYISYGMIMGIGLGIGYLCPVKTLMLWFRSNPGLATGLAIMGFGLSKSIFSPYIEWCTKEYNIYITLMTMAAFSFVLMGIATAFIKKPKEWKESKVRMSIQHSLSIITSPTYLKIWTIFFLNITCGLVIISFEKGMSIGFGISAAAIGLVSAAAAVMNALGRFGYSTLSDRFSKKIRIYNIIFSSCILMVGLFLIGQSNMYLWLLLLMTVNLGYGGGFSTLPVLLSNIFGMERISTIHGFALSAWAWASVAAFVITQLFIYKLELSFDFVLMVLGLLFCVAFVISLTIKERKIR